MTFEQTVANCSLDGRLVQLPPASPPSATNSTTAGSPAGWDRHGRDHPRFHERESPPEQA
ncbi:hypothetical protein [Micromonospora marina]|uniref:hypothetical protein n=1 Tax=Micromonospora marina TaxID=307120 RepID=UPI003D726C51